MSRPIVVFCTARPGDVSRVVRSALGDPGAHQVVYVGSGDSPFATVAQKFISWGNGPFGLMKAVRLWSKIAGIDPETIILPINNLDGKGYLLLRVFSRIFAGRGALEALQEGPVQPISFRSVSNTCGIEKSIHAATLSIFEALKPVFRIWLRPATPSTRPHGGIRSHTVQRNIDSTTVPEVSVIIRAFNEEKLIGKTLEAVFAQKGPAFEVIVIDSESTDSTPRIAVKYPVRLIRISRSAFGYGAALNLGAQLARGRYVANLSAHAVPAGQAWLRDLLAPLSDPTVAGVHGAELPLEGHCGLLERKILEDSFPRTAMERTSDSFFSNANSAMKRETLLNNPFDETVPWAEDRLWAEHMQKQGFKTAYAPGAAVYHSHNLTARGNFSRSLKFFAMQFETALIGDPEKACEEFRRSLPARATEFRRFLADRKLLNPLAAMFYAPFQEYANFLGCDFACEFWRSGLASGGELSRSGSVSPQVQRQTVI